jgi:hypothetical protein
LLARRPRTEIGNRNFCPSLTHTSHCVICNMHTRVFSHTGQSISTCKIHRHRFVISQPHQQKAIPASHQKATTTITCRVFERSPPLVASLPPLSPSAGRVRPRPPGHAMQTADCRTQVAGLHCCSPAGAAAGGRKRSFDESLARPARNVVFGLGSGASR